MPTSPHLQIWRWHVTMAASIFTRATGVALYVGLFVVVAWAVSLAAGPDSYELFMGLMASWLGKLVLFGLTFAVLFNIAYTVRQTFWDAGKGFTPKVADMTGACAIAFAAVGAIVVWVIAAQTGAL